MSKLNSFIYCDIISESGESETENQTRIPQQKRVKKTSNLNNQKTPHHLTLSYGRRTPIMTTRIHPGTKLISENVRKVVEVKNNNNVKTVMENLGYFGRNKQLQSTIFFGNRMHRV